ADREDTWLHAQGCPGAHVIVHREGHRGDPPRRSLEEAAALAAYWSKARGAKTVPVIHTRVKYVRKPKGAPPGVVNVTHEKTIFVEPAPLQLL
ncbi:MAG: fibronectin-binding domain-containing protein, partial [Candidatus Latescibacteria bacterium]|nr:fibronectin-binding domain-containing protein [Candidatus Latescibacterota bacterium]